MFRDNVSVTVRPYERSDSEWNEDSSAAGKAWEGKAAQTGWPSGIMDGGNWKRDPQSHVWTYIKADGNAAVSEWGCINGTWYFFGADGRMVSDQWIKDGPKWYLSMKAAECVRIAGFFMRITGIIWERMV